MKKIILLFTSLFLMALISCGDSPEEPDVTSTPQPGEEGELGGIPLQGSLTQAGDLNYKAGSTDKLDGDQEIEGGKYRFFYADDTEVTFYSPGFLKGEFQSGFLAFDYEVDIGVNEDILLKAKSKVAFLPAGNFLIIRLPSDQTLTVRGMDITFKAYGNSTVNEITFYNSGEVLSGVLASNHTLTVGGNPIEFSGHISFYNNGEEVEIGVLARSTTLTVGGIDIEFNGFEIEFYKDGKVKKGLNGGYIVNFNTAGNTTSSNLFNPIP